MVKKTILATILFILLTTTSVMAVGLSPALVTLDYVPGEVHDIEYTVRNNAPGPVEIQLSLEGEAAGLATLSESVVPLEAGTEKKITISINMPLKTELVGLQKIFISAFEKRLTENDAMIAATVTVKPDIRIYFPYPGKYILLEGFGVSNVNEGENATATISYRGMGQLATNVNSKIAIYDKDRNIVLEKDLPMIVVQPTEVKQIEDSLDLSGNPFGSYTAKLTASFTDMQQTKEASFFIGTQDIQLVEFIPDEFFYNEITNFEFTMENLWNGNFDNVYGEIEIAGRSAITPSRGVGPLKKEKFQQYIDLRGIEPGNKTGKITVHYGENAKEFPIQVKILTEEETNEKLGKKDPINYMLVIVLVMAVIIIAGLILVLTMLKKEKNTQKKKK